MIQTTHSKRRMSERGFRQEKIESILNGCGYPEYKGKAYHYADQKGKVIVVQEDRIITVYHRKP